MSREEFKMYIESIGFKYNGHGYYVYKEYEINLYIDHYDFNNGSEWVFYINFDIRPFDMYFKRELRSFKLKELLRCV